VSLTTEFSRGCGMAVTAVMSLSTRSSTLSGLFEHTVSLRYAQSSGIKQTNGLINIQVEQLLFDLIETYLLVPGKVVGVLVRVQPLVLVRVSRCRSAHLPSRPSDRPRPILLRWSNRRRSFRLRYPRRLLLRPILFHEQTT